LQIDRVRAVGVEVARNREIRQPRQRWITGNLQRIHKNSDNVSDSDSDSNGDSDRGQSRPCTFRQRHMNDHNHPTTPRPLYRTW
jgi:hypothetical protein